jgi:hypothetical protein
MKKTFLFLLILTISFVAKAEIISTHDAGVIKSKAEDLKPGDMLLFDVKDIIFYAEDQVMSLMHKPYFKEKFVEIEAKLGKAEANRLKSIVLDSYKPMLVDIEIPKIIKNAQRQGILAFGLTSGKTSEYGVIASRTDKRVETLKAFGIDFSKSLDLESINLHDENDREIEERGRSMFQEGVIFAARLPKGDILGRFLKESKLTPGKIIFVDNQIKNLHSVGEKCQELDIEYVGILFTKLLGKTYTHLDEEIADKKFEILLEKEEWISDEEAKRLLGK